MGLEGHVDINKWCEWGGGRPVVHSSVLGMFYILLLKVSHLAAPFIKLLHLNEISARITYF